LERRKTNEDAIGEGAAGYSRGGCAPHFPSAWMFLHSSFFAFRYFFIQLLAP
jgi:hypothetical protein